jgi:hypothetical protein
MAMKTFQKLTLLLALVLVAGSGGALNRYSRSPRSGIPRIPACTRI